MQLVSRCEFACFEPRRFLFVHPVLRLSQPAIDEVEKVRKDLMTKTEISCSDILAFAGSVALEATGAPLQRPLEQCCVRDAD